MATSATFGSMYGLLSAGGGAFLVTSESWVFGGFTLSSGPSDPTPGTISPGEEVRISARNWPTLTGAYVGQWNGSIVTTLDGSPLPLLFSKDPNLEGLTITPSFTEFTWCFMEGTLIRTPDGEVAVESLRIGDAVLGADGRAHRVHWLGTQKVMPLFAHPLAGLPIEIAAGALGEGLPARDLRLSPSHAVRIGDLLVEAAALVNGTTIRRLTAAELPERFTYFHIETEGHELVLAEGLPAETFVDNVSRRSFDNWADYVALFGEEERVMPATGLDLPRVKAPRQLPLAIREAIAARAAALASLARAA